jgi:hypothetical protein
MPAIYSGWIRATVCPVPYVAAVRTKYADGGCRDGQALGPDRRSSATTRGPAVIAVGPPVQHREAARRAAQRPGGVGAGARAGHEIFRLEA